MPTPKPLKSKKTKSNITNRKLKYAYAKPKQSGRTTNKICSALKGVKNGGQRLSASFYFNVVCDGKISRCSPQWILQPSGEHKMKKIVIVNGAHGREPRWRNV